MARCSKIWNYNWHPFVNLIPELPAWWPAAFQSFLNRSGSSSAEKTLTEEGSNSSFTKRVAFHRQKKKKSSDSHQEGSPIPSENRHYAQAHRGTQKAKPFVEVVRYYQNGEPTTLSVEGAIQKEFFFLIGEFNLSYWITCQILFSFHASLNSI